ncbi:MAG: 3-deoxy-manno-octulosonate cytidylyltransferase [Candidatus Ratteibacteria bacterium]|jgi:3-deoxy-manno-octulosonate cytidylyltransferase (CMP-KDO synthetase)
MAIKVLGVIPARYASSRYPGKVLEKIGERTMLESVYLHAKQARILDKIIIATDDRRIADEAERIGAEWMMTSSQCSCGTERVAEVSRTVNASFYVNIQADEPFVPSEAIRKPVEALMKESKLLCATPAARIRRSQDLYNPNITKVVFTREGNALYFSGSILPFPRVYFADGHDTYFKKVLFYKHVGVYAFRKSLLTTFARLPASGLEKTEQLEQLRMLENGWTIRVVLIRRDSPSVDSAEDLLFLNTKGII